MSENGFFHAFHVLTGIFAAPVMFTKLPNELTARICSFLAKDDLAAFRLIDKQIGATATREFAIRYFTKLSVRMSLGSLRALVAICGHPVMGQYVREIQFSSLCTSTTGIELLSKSYEETNVKDDDYKPLQKAYDILRVYEDRRFDERALGDGDLGIRLITTALSSLKQHNNDFRLFTKDFEDKGAIGCQGLAKTLRFRPQKHRNRDSMDMVMHILIEGASRSGCTVTDFAVTHKSSGRSCFFDLKDLKNAGVMKKVFKSVKNLWLDFDGPPMDATMTSMEMILSSALALEALFLTLDARSVRDKSGVKQAVVETSEKLLSGVKSKHLRELHFHGLCVSQKNLMTVLTLNRQTLQVLELDYVSVRHGSWELILTWIRENLSLESLSLCRLVEISEGKSQNVDYRKDQIKELLYLEGRCSIRSGLIDLLAAK